ncbi:hypothetical protein [Cohnella algarum]|uniref:hypothetical protein n=1 Tax=Cohnella algarum TaxID=2044859 RepID=UPI00196878B5|nr:hypothetical protein [Cohnella algarum]MBN2983029.1 hypothetical protein [Cohnella algarum]
MIGHTGLLGYTQDSFFVGENGPTPVSESYAAPFRFGGTLKSVTYTLGGFAPDIESRLALELATE